MKPQYYRTALLALLIAASLAGCASKPATRPNKAANVTTAHTSPSSNAKPAANALPANTGITACDDYLASYVACHRTAAIYAPDQIDSHYQDMRTSLLRDSLDPTIRPQLGARCTSLAVQLRQALHGKSCATAGPSTAASSGR